MNIRIEVFVWALKGLNRGIVYSFNKYLLNTYHVVASFQVLQIQQQNKIYQQPDCIAVSSFVFSGGLITKL